MLDGEERTDSLRVTENWKASFLCIWPLKTSQGNKNTGLIIHFAFSSPSMRQTSILTVSYMEANLNQKKTRILGARGNNFISSPPINVPHQVKKLARKYDMVLQFYRKHKTRIRYMIYGTLIM
ncbi:hypothetical protein E2320_017272, partial [Naja naja]